MAIDALPSQPLHEIIHYVLAKTRSMTIAPRLLSHNGTMLFQIEVAANCPIAYELAMM